MRRLIDRQCLEHQCPLIVIDDLGYDIVSCLVDWISTLIGSGEIVDVIPGGVDGVQLIFSNGTTFPLLSPEAERVRAVHEANELLGYVSGARIGEIKFVERDNHQCIVMIFHKANGDTLIVESHPLSAIQMEPPRQMKLR